MSRSMFIVCGEALFDVFATGDTPTTFVAVTDLGLARHVHRPGRPVRGGDAAPGADAAPAPARCHGALGGAGGWRDAVVAAAIVASRCKAAVATPTTNPSERDISKTVRPRAKRTLLKIPSNASLATGKISLRYNNIDFRTLYPSLHTEMTTND